MIDLPEPVKSYLRNPDIATAVKALTVGKQKLPTGLTWETLEDYYQAVAAAQQVKATYAVALHRLWEAAWGEAVASLKQITPDKVTDAGYLNSVDECWENECYGRCLELTADRWLWADVGMDAQQCHVGVAIDHVKQRALLKELPGFEKADSAEWVYLQAGPPMGEDDVLPALRAAAQQAVEVARRLVSD